MAMDSTSTRLSKATHRLAQIGKSGEWGRTLVSASGLAKPDGEGERAYAQTVKTIAENAPLRFDPEQRLAGSATLSEACLHQVPIMGISSVSHTTVGFERILKEGTNGTRKRIQERIDRGGLDPKGLELLEAMLVCLDALDIWVQRTIDHLSCIDHPNAKQVIENLRRVPANPPRTFYEATQSLWTLFCFQRLCGNWSGIGRFDLMLGPYLSADLKSQRITIDEARELIAHFWINGTEWTGASTAFGGSGDAQFYQNIVLGGVDSKGQEVTNEVTYLVLDVVEELGISDFPIAVRLNCQSPEKLLRRVAEVQRKGGGIVAVYNEEVVIKALHQFGYTIEQARSFANDGCWEAIIPGETAFIYRPFDSLQLLLATIKQDSYPTWDDLYSAFIEALTAELDRHHRQADEAFNDGEPATLISLMVDCCIEKARGYNDRGARYTVLSPHLGGIADTANSLLAIKQIVFEENKVTLSELKDILKNDWNGREELRKYVLNRVPTYGNDDPAADAMLQRIYNDFTAIVDRCRERNGVQRPAGISTFGRQIAWASERGATPDGHKAGDILASNLSPSPGTDMKGPTAALNSYCKMDFTRLPNCGTLELKIDPISVKGEEGINALVGLLKTFVDQGGCFLHVDVVDTDLLKEAQQHPDRYPNLAVRISGWSARFATLDKHWQDMVIERTRHQLHP
jgi:formate C-acetyltransferase